MFHLLIDTSVWLDLAADQRQAPLLEVLHELLHEGHATLVLPQTVVTEFHKNRERVAKASAKSLASHFGQVRDAIKKVDGNQRQKDKVLDFLADVDHRIPLIGGAASATLDRIDELFKKTPVNAPTDAVKARAADRAINRRAPCHHDKNSMADAVLIETYLDYVKGHPGAGQRFAFVTHNKNDFSLVNGNQKLPHADIASGFSKIKSMYFINLADCLRRIEPMRVTHLMWELEWDQQPRGLTEILKWMDRLTMQVWHNRHMNWVWRVEHGKEFIVSREEWDKGFAKHGYKYNAKHTPKDIWDGARRAAAAARKKLGPGPDGSGPYTDFEWGMVNGKLSALRWVLGDEWDMLDT